MSDILWKTRRHLWHIREHTGLTKVQGSLIIIINKVQGSLIVIINKVHGSLIVNTKVQGSLIIMHYNACENTCNVGTFV